MSFFQTSDGKPVDGSQGYEGGGNNEPIPHGTQINVMIESAAWKTGQDGVDRVKTKARVVDGEHANRVIFDTLDICSPDQKRRNTHIKKFAAVDYAAKTGIVAGGEAPTDEQLYAFVGTELVYTMGIFVPKDKPEPVQYVMGIKAPGQAPAKPAPAKAALVKQGPRAAGFDEDSIPF